MYSKNTLEQQFDEEFAKKHFLKIMMLNSEERQVMNHVIRDSIYWYDERSKYPVKIKPQKITLLSDFARSNYGRVINLLVPKEFIDDFYKTADNMINYQFDRTYSRRSFRSKSYNTVAYNIFPLMYSYYILGFLDINKDNFNNYLTEQFNGDKGLFRRFFKDNIIATRIDAGDQKLIDLLKNMMTAENNTDILSYNAIRAVIMSSNEELHDLLCKLLVAARLQEGLRQAICESADCGTAKAFIKILNTIKENNLIRFPSVQRAIGTWTGICREGDPGRIANKLLEDILFVLERRENCLSMIDTTDTIHIYSGLWGLSFYDIDDAVNEIYRLTGILGNSSVTADRVRFMTIGYFCNQIESKEIADKVSKAALEAFPDDYEMFSLFINSYSYYNRCRRNDKKVDIIQAESAVKQYDILMNMYKIIPKKKMEFDPIVFPWYKSEISKGKILKCMLGIACTLNDDEKLEWLGEHMTEFDTYSRSDVIDAIGEEIRTDKQREIIINAVADKESYTRSHAVKIIKNMTLTENEYEVIESFARFKTADLREGIITLLKLRKPNDLASSVMRMLKSSNENVRLAALDLILYLKAEYPSFDISMIKEAVKSIESPCESEMVIINEIVGSDNAVKLSNENGYGLYDVNARIAPAKINADVEAVKDYFSVSFEDITQMHLDLMAIIDKNANLEFKDYNGEEKLLGNFGNLRLQWSDNYEIRIKQKLHEVTPFRELWAEFYKNSIRTPQRFWAFVLSSKKEYPNSISPAAKRIFDKNVRATIGKIYEYDYQSSLVKKDERFGNYRFAWLRNDVIYCIISEFEIFLPMDISRSILLYTSRNIPTEELLLQREDEDVRITNFMSRYSYLKNFLIPFAERQLIKSFYDDFETNFRVFHELSLKEQEIELLRVAGNEKLKSNPHPYRTLLDYFIAFVKGFITRDELYEVMFDMFGLSNTFRSLGHYLYFGIRTDQTESVEALFKNENLTFSKKYELPHDSSLYKAIEQIHSELLKLVLSFELKRGDSETDFSSASLSIQKIYGMETLADILRALGNETLDRSSYYYGSPTKKVCLSSLLSCCYPNEDDDPEKLAKYVKEYKISTDRLIEVAMFAPQWIDIIEKHLKIDGFKSGCYYFMAHTAENISPQRKAIIAKYTPLTEEELNGGCFDVKWFNEAYNILGDKMFNKIYKSAKYISSSNKHTRARKYADAALGKLDIKETEKTISDKRNKDLLMSLAIIPSKDKNDILDRYEFIQNYLKESKKFGAQRRASEADAVSYAIKNLAVTAGYSDESRLTLSMETELVKANKRFFDKTHIGEYDVCIEVDEFGKSALKIEKNGKALKSAPAAIKKDEVFISIKDFQNKLKQQYSRTVKMFEAAMEERELFDYPDLILLCENPVTAAIIKNLVFVVVGESFLGGFIRDNGLIDTDGTVHILNGESKLRAAHPFDLNKGNVWTDYQKFILEHEIKQPFRQVFRELYVKLPEELDKTSSRMFAGYQIQVKRTISALSGRRWVVDFEDGLQKVYYKDNVIAEIYAVADWFSPSDIEAPALESVIFTDRKSYKPLKISEVPDIIYSEVMRDVDLAVSVAHAGGVDPETGHSTIEMRKVIIEFNLKLFGINNVTLDKNHAIIDGKYGKYTVHLGSGVIHKMGGRMINVVSVSVGKKSKIFLPFIDDDPKTSEIMTKIITFANDSKIKDPFIMEQIKN